MKLVAKKAYKNGKIFTCNDYQPWAQSVITCGDKILFVGSNADAKRYIDHDTQVFDLDGKLMLPGFIDSHLHFIAGGFSLVNVDLGHVKTKEQFKTQIAKFIKVKKGSWILGGNWDHYMFDEQILPSKEWVDLLTPDVPLFVTRSDLHMGLANSKALSLAGISKDASNPKGGIIEKDVSSGEPTGILIDNAMQMIFDILPEPSEEESFKALQMAMKEANKFGITSVHDVVYSKDYTVYQEFMSSNNLTCRVNLIRPITELQHFAKLKIRCPFGNEYLKIGALKAFADGSLGSATAWFFDPYFDDPKSSGLPMDVLVNGNLRKWALEADRNKLQLAIHAIGDRAISRILDIYEEIVNTNPVWERRLRLEHVQHIRKEDIKRMKKLDVIASMQPYHLHYDGAWCESKIGRKRVADTYAIKSLLNAGVKVCFGSDWTVVSPNPLLGTYAAVARLVIGREDQGSWNPAEKISVEEALKCYTINAAYASFEDDIKGSIEAGKLADFVILSDNIFEIPPIEIKDVCVEKTIFAGDIVYIRNTN